MTYPVQNPHGSHSSTHLTDQRHYDHLTTLMHVKELVGSEGAELTKLIKAYSAL